MEECQNILHKWNELPTENTPGAGSRSGVLALSPMFLAVKNILLNKRTTSQKRNPSVSTSPNGQEKKNRLGALEISAIAALVLLVSIFLLWSSGGVFNRKQSVDILNPAERQWLNEHAADLTIAPDYSFAPYEFFDERGEFQGIAADYVKLLEQKLGCKFTILKIKDWNENVQKAKNREFAVWSAVAPTAQKQEYMLFTKPYLEVTTALIISKDFPGELSLETFGERTITVVDGYFTHDYLQRYYPDIKIVTAKNSADGLRAVAFKEVDAMLIDIATASYLIETEGISTLKVAETIHLDYNLAFASRKDLPILNHILDKGLASITPQERQAIYAKWVHYANPNQQNYQTILSVALIISGLLFLILVGILLWNTSLRRNVASQTRSLMESEARYRTLIEQASDGIFIANEKGQYIDVNSAGCRLVGYTREEILQKTMSEIARNVPNQPLRMDELRQGKTILSERELIRKDGTLVLVEISAKQLPDGTLQGIVRDITERKQAAAEMESMARFPAENPNPVLRVNQDGNLLYTNEAGLMLLPDWNLAIGEPAPQILRQAVVETLSGDETKIVEVTQRSRVISFSVTPIAEAGYANFYGSDITERKQTEDTLRESEEKYRRLFDNASLGIFQSTPEGKAISVNSAFAHMFGYDSPEDALKSIKNVATDVFADPNRRGEIIRLMAQNPDLRTFENLYRRKDGSTFIGSLNTIPIKNSDGRLVRIEGIIEDITERRQAEETLLKSVALYRQAIEVANAVPYHQTYYVNGNSVDYDFIGEGIRQITGYGPEEFNEALWDSLTQERFLLEDLAGYPFGEAIERVRSGVNPVWKCNHRIRARDGKIRWVFEAAVELRDENGVSHGSIGMFQDITERKRTEEEILSLNAELEQRVLNRTVQLETANKEMEAFSYSVSHDLRAPLRGIDGWSLALLEDYGDQLDEQGREYIKRVRNETQRMGHLIDEMLQLSRLTRTEMRRERVNLSAIAETIAARLQESAPERVVEINIQAGLSAIGDTQLLEVALSNLLENAFKFTSKRTGARIEFGQVESQGKRTFFVRDNGAGFDMAYSQKLFGAFQRMHKTSEFPGTGIGLATVQRIIHRHGGRVWAEAEIHKGATFYFTLEESL